MNIREFQELQPDEAAAAKFFGQHTTCGCDRFKGICDKPWCANSYQPLWQEHAGREITEHAYANQLYQMLALPQNSTARVYRVRWEVSAGAQPRVVQRPFAEQRDAEVFAKGLVDNELATVAEVYTVLATFTKEPEGASK